MDGDDLSDDVFIDKHVVINRDELRIAKGQIPTIPISSGARAGGCVDKDEEEVRIYAPVDYDDGLGGRRHENYFYPDNAAICEGWRSYKIEDEEPFGPIADGPAGAPIKINNHSSSTYFRPADATASKRAVRPDFDASVTHKVNIHALGCFYWQSFYS